MEEDEYNKKLARLIHEIKCVLNNEPYRMGLDALMTTIGHLIEDSVHDHEYKLYHQSTMVEGMKKMFEFTNKTGWNVKEGDEKVKKIDMSGI